MSEIIVYTTSSCPWCRMLKEFLNEKKVKFRNVDVGADSKAAKEMIEKSGQMGVPQIEINGKLIVGFDKDAIEEELKKAKLL